MLRLFILLVAVGAGGAAAWLSMAPSSPPPPAPITTAPTAVPMAQVLVAANPLTPGRTLLQEDMRWQAWPADALIAGAILRAEQPQALAGFVGQMTRVDLAAGEPIRAKHLVSSDGGFLSGRLNSGQRAVAVRISPESTAGGFIMPNDRVDVLRTFNQPSADGQSRMVSETILRNIHVLAIDQSTDSTGEDAVLGKTATLELNTTEVEILTAGEASGLLSLSLRSFADNDDAPSSVATPVSKPALRIYRGGVLEQVARP